MGIWGDEPFTVMPIKNLVGEFMGVNSIYIVLSVRPENACSLTGFCDRILWLRSRLKSGVCSTMFAGHSSKLGLIRSSCIKLAIRVSSKSSVCMYCVIFSSLTEFRFVSPVFRNWFFL